MSRHPERLDDRRRNPPEARLMPHDLEVEESLLGAMLLTRVAIEAAAAHITDGADFYRPAHGHVYDAIAALHRDHSPADPVTVAAHLRANGLLDHVGGSGALVALQTGTPSTTSAGRYAEIVAGHARRRRAIAVLNDATEALYAEIAVDPTAIIEALDATSTTQQDDSWRALDISDLLHDLDAEPERLGLTRVDGKQLIQCGVMTLLVGPPETGKSWVAILSAVDEIHAGRPVIWIDLEQGPLKVARDLHLAGLTLDQIIVHLRYVPVDRIPRTNEVRRLGAAHIAQGGRLAVIDSTGELIERMGFSAQQEARAALHMVCDPLLMAGCTVVGIDHVVKDETQRGNYAVGDQGKTAKTTVTIGFDVVEPFGPGRRGTANLSVRKDRWGAFRDTITVIGKSRRWGQFVIDSTGEFSWSVELPPSGDDTERQDTPTIRRERKKRQDRSLLQHEEIRDLIDAAKERDNTLTVARVGMILGSDSRTTVQRRMEVLEEMRLVTKEVRRVEGQKNSVAVWVLTDFGRTFRK